MQDKKAKQNVGFSERADDCSSTIPESIVDPSSELEDLLGLPPDSMFDTPLPDVVETDGHEAERLRIRIWNDIIRLKHLKEHHKCKMIQQSSASLLDYSQEQSRRKKLARNLEKILNEMLELVEEGLAQGFIYGIVPYKGKPVSGDKITAREVDILNAVLRHELKKYFGHQHNSPPPPPSMVGQSCREAVGDASTSRIDEQQPISEAMQEESMNVTQYLAMDVNMFTRPNLPSYELGPQDQPRGSIHQDKFGHIHQCVASASHGNQPLANPYGPRVPVAADSPVLPSGGIEMRHQGTSSSDMHLFQTRLNQDQAPLPEVMKVEIDPLFSSSVQEDETGTSITRELANLMQPQIFPSDETASFESIFGHNFDIGPASYFSTTDQSSRIPYSFHELDEYDWSKDFGN
ncbi:hypothetical protein GW17_00038359 [Ensete ventricosum]|nr:hypothetical protein GW17_00038359 [Ensete ventricosum]